MSKKAEVAIIDKATISNNINLNINQNDLIDLAIAEHMTRIEEHLKKVRDSIANVTKECDDILNENAKILTTTFLRKNKETAAIEKVLAIGNKKIDDCIKATLKNNNDYRTNTLGEYKRYSHDIEECASARSFESSSYNQSFNEYDLAYINISLSEDIGSLKVSMNTNVDISSTDKTRIEKKLVEPNKRWYKLLVEKHEVEKEYIRYRFGEKKMKAALVRAALSKSKEGQGILKMLEQVSTIKLLK